MLDIAFGHSADVDLDICIGDVIGQVAPLLARVDDAAGLLFVSDGLDDASVARRIKNAFPHLKLIGCCSAGETSSALGFQEDSVLLVVMASPDVSFAVGIGRNLGAEPEKAIDSMVAGLEEVLAGAKASVCFAFLDPVHRAADFVLERLSTSLDGNPRIIGGGANASTVAEDAPSNVYFEGEAASDAIVTLVLSGDVDVSVSTITSWKPIGHSGVITRVDAHTVQEIDGRPALDFLRRNLGAETSIFMGAPLAIVESEKSLNVRTAIGVDEEARTVTLGGAIHEGDVVQLSYATFNDIRDGAVEAAANTHDALGEDAAVVFFFSCVARKMFLAMDVKAEGEELQARFGRDVPVAGFYAYGEVSALETGDPAKFRNQAIVSVALA